MLASPKDVLTAFPVRRTKKQKQAFRETVQSYLSDLGYETRVEKGGFGCQNLTAGSPETAKFLIGAADANSAILTLLEIAGTLPENQRSKACFVLFDGERIGAASYRKAHKETVDNQLVLVLEEIGSGDRIRMFPTKTLKNDRRKLTSLYKACGYFGRKSVLVYEESLRTGCIAFSNAVQLCSLQNGKKESYHNRIRTCENTIPEETNINILRAGLISFITCTN